MPVFQLQVKATLENVEKLYAPKNMSWNMRFSCLSCNELSKNSMQFTAEDKHEAGRGTFNLTSRCQFCGRLRTADIVEKSEQAYKTEDNSNFKTVIKLECRGMEPVNYSPGEGWIVEAQESAERFNDVDLKECEWVDYDTKQKRPVGIYSLEYKFVKE